MDQSWSDSIGVDEEAASKNLIEPVLPWLLFPAHASAPSASSTKGGTIRCYQL